MTDAERDEVLELARIAARLGARAEVRVPWPPPGSGNVADLVVSDRGAIVAYLIRAVPGVGPMLTNDHSAQTVIEVRFLGPHLPAMLKGPSEEEWRALIAAMPALRTQLEPRG